MRENPAQAVISNAEQGLNGNAVPLEFNIEAAQRFLSMLDPAASAFTFQTFDDNKTRQKTNKEALGYDPLERVIHGTLEECAGELQELNRRGAGIFVAVNRIEPPLDDNGQPKTRGKGVRTKRNLSAIRANFSEDDTGFQGKYPLEPSIIVESSPGKKHVYWIDAEPVMAGPAKQDAGGRWTLAAEALQARAEFDAIQAQLVAHFGSDKNAKDVTRVLRLPGFFHMKQPDRPHLVCILETSGQRCSLAKRMQAFNAHVPEIRPRIFSRGSEARSAQHLRREKLTFKSAIVHLRVDENFDWYLARLALQRSILPEQDAFELFDELSAKSDGYCGTEDCWREWDRGTEDEGRSDAELYRMGSLLAKAKENGWKGFPFTHEDYALLAEGIKADDIDDNETATDYLNNKIAYLRDTGMFFSFELGKPIMKDQLLDTYKNEYFMKMVKAKGGTREERQEILPLWQGSRQRRDHASIAFEPDQPPITAGNSINLFVGFSTMPKKGDAEPFLKLVLRSTNGNVEYAAFIVDWLAHKIQKPWIKMETAVFVMSKMHGVGKGLLIDLVAEDLFGKYYTPTTTKAQKSQFNGFKAGSLLAVCDEACYTGRLDLAEALKSEITAPTILIDEKHQRKYRVKNLCELYVTSNRINGIYAQDHDRRYAAFRAAEERIPEKDALDYVAWWQREGKHYVMDFLLSRDLSKFNPHAPAPETEFKREIIAAGRTHLQQLAADLAQDCDGYPLRELMPLILFGKDFKPLEGYDRQRYAMDIARYKREENLLALELRNANSPPKRELRIKRKLRTLWAVATMKGGGSRAMTNGEANT